MTGPAASGQIPRLALSGITKAFPGVLANDGVDFDVHAGEIHALLGENGAGKSTLVKMIYGVLHPDAGEIRWEGRPVTIADPHAARRLGIGMVFQHFSLFEAMSVLENVALGLEEPGPRRELTDRVAKVSRSYGLPLDPNRHVHELSVGERQRIEIVRCLLQDPKLIVMDEPTSVLTPQEVEVLFNTLRQLSAEGRSILYISHKLDEIKALCDRATVLRGGKVVAHADPAKETARSLAQMMVGSTLNPPQRREAGALGGPLLRVEGLSLAGDGPFGTALRGISFEVRAGELLGVAGVAGNGQAELLAALSGERLSAPESIKFNGRPVGRSGPRARRKAGLCYIPEERNGHAAVASLSLSDNALLSALDREALAPNGLLRSGKAKSYAKSVIERFAVKANGPDALAGSLSGGNLQKFVCGREIMQRPEVLIAAQPTWGVDAGAAARIHAELLGLAEQGVAVLVVSQDLDELLQVTDRLAVINAGRLSEPVATATADRDEIGLLMGGLHDLEATPDAA